MGLWVSIIDVWKRLWGCCGEDVMGVVKYGSMWGSFVSGCEVI